MSLFIRACPEGANLPRFSNVQITRPKGTLETPHFRIKILVLQFSRSDVSALTGQKQKSVSSISTRANHA